jgi:hypothetical protein
VDGAEAELAEEQVLQIVVVQERLMLQAHQEQHPLSVVVVVAAVVVQQCLQLQQNLMQMLF